MPYGADTEPTAHVGHACWDGAVMTASVWGRGASGKGDGNAIGACVAEAARGGGPGVEPGVPDLGLRSEQATLVRVSVLCVGFAHTCVSVDLCGKALRLPTATPNDRGRLHCGQLTQAAFLAPPPQPALLLAGAPERREESAAAWARP